MERRPTSTSQSVQNHCSWVRCADWRFDLGNTQRSMIGSRLTTAQSSTPCLTPSMLLATLLFYPVLPILGKSLHDLKSLGCTLSLVLRDRWHLAVIAYDRTFRGRDTSLRAIPTPRPPPSLHLCRPATTCRLHPHPNARSKVSYDHCKPLGLALFLLALVS